MDVWDYYARREREFEEMSLDGRDVDYFEEEGSDGERGHLVGNAHLDDGTFLAIHERVEVVDNVVVRTEYSYYLIVEGVEYWGWDFDPNHDPATHRHTQGHKDCLPADEISFKRVCELAWREVSVRETI